MSAIQQLCITDYIDTQILYVQDSAAMYQHIRLQFKRDLAAMYQHIRLQFKRTIQIYSYYYIKT